MQSSPVPDEEQASPSCCGSFSWAELTKPVEFRGDPVYDEPVENAFFSWPFFGLLLLENQTSDARDHCANERTFLSYLRLSVYMAIVAVAIVLSFHLRTEPSPLELKIAKPLGITFWALAVACLFVGFGNYMKTVNKYARKAAIVQSGWITQSLMTMIAISIIGTCVAMLVIAQVEVAE